MLQLFLKYDLVEDARHYDMEVIYNSQNWVIFASILGVVFFACCCFQNWHSTLSRFALANFACLFACSFSSRSKSILSCTSSTYFEIVLSSSTMTGFG